MDEVPIVTANPVNLIINKQEPTPKLSRKGRIMETLKNFFMMMPLALIVIAQFFFLGASFGKFSTFPITSVTTYILLASILLVLLFSQMLMRSIIYSSLAGAALLMGLFYAWIGDFYTPMVENYKGISLIIKSAWTRKDVPFNLLVTGGMTALLAAVVFVQFFFALLIKSFFEMLFGKEWGDGRVVAFLGTIALLAGIHIGFYSYSSMSSNTKEKLLWERVTKYRPVEKFITRTPDNFLIGADRIYVALDGEGVALDLATGKSTEQRIFKPASVHKGFQKCDLPVFTGQDGLYGFNKELNMNTWKTPYPASFPGLEIDAEKQELFNSTPLTTKLVEGGRKLLAFYDYGYMGMYDTLDGKELWLQKVDLPIRTNRVFPELYLETGHFIEAGSKLIFSCHNGLVRCLNTANGTQAWQYIHTTPKISGKPQKGFLTLHGQRVVVAFRSGEIVTLEVEDGRKVYQATNTVFSPSAPVFCKDLTASFLTDEGMYYCVKLDGGQIVFSANTLPRKLDLVPVVQDLNEGIIAHRDEVKKVNLELKTVETIYTSKNRIFITTPVFDDKIMYIGTQDGWIFCLHTGSMHEKWHIHVDGELKEDSLALLGDTLLVKTSSGSLYRFNRNF